MFDKIKVEVGENEVLNSLQDLKGIELLRDEQEFLNSLILRNKPKKIVEIGVSAGGSATLILNAINSYKDSHLYSIDYLKHYYRDPTKKVGFMVEEKYPHLSNNWTLYGGGLTLDFIEEIGGNIDFCFIDTIHVCPGEILDFLMILPFLKKGATVVIHDISVHIRDYVNSKAISNCILMSAINGEKLVSQGNYNYPSNIGAIKMSDDINSTIENVINLLVVTWQYALKDNEIEKVHRFLKKYYNSKIAEKFLQIANIQTLNSRNKKQFERKQGIERFCKNINVKKVVIYGTGELSKMILENMPENIEILYFVVSEPKDNEKFMGFNVRHPKELKNIKKDTYIIISSLSFSDEMEKNVKDFSNVSSDKIISLQQYIYG